MWRRKKERTPADIVAHQRAMNRDTWAALQENGVTDGMQLRLDFFYVAPRRGASDELAGFLRAETDYDVRADDTSVSGSTKPTTVSPRMLDDWVEWMVLAGHEHGRCEFDGWGAAIP